MAPAPCSVCLQPCIARCPACRQPVHYGYGQGNDNCSGRHEAACPGARAQRVLPVETKEPATAWLRRLKRKRKRKS